VAAGAGEFDGAGAVGVAEIGRRAVRQRASMAAGEQGMRTSGELPAGVVGFEGCV
jgi:hypothetical protein